MTSEEVLGSTGQGDCLFKGFVTVRFLWMDLQALPLSSIKVIRELLCVCRKVSVTVTMDVLEPFVYKEKSHQLFYMSHKMIRSLSELTRDMEEPVWVKPEKPPGFAKAPALSFLGAKSVPVITVRYIKKKVRRSLFLQQEVL